MKQQIVDKMVKWLFREEDWSLSFSEKISLAYVTLIKDSPQFSELFFNALKAKIEKSFNDARLSPTQKDIILYNALSYLAFSSPQEHHRVSIQGIEYTIEKIALTSGWLSAPYYAYGLKAKMDPRAQSFLVFQGTTTPADHGFLAGILADTRPHGAVGAHLYSRGKKPIQAWINAEYSRTGKPVLCTGQSLGGAMSLHAHIHQPDKVDFFVINPPYLTHREKRIYEKKPMPSLTQRTLKVLAHCKDPVRNLGDQYLPPETQLGIHGDHQDPVIAAHARSASCQPHSPEITFIPYKEKIVTNHSWKVTKFFLFLTLCLLCVIALPFRLGIKAAQVVMGQQNTAPKSPPESDTLTEHNDSIKNLSALTGLGQQDQRETTITFEAPSPNNALPLFQPKTITSIQRSAESVPLRRH